VSTWHIFNLDGPELKAYLDTLPPLTEEGKRILTARLGEARREMAENIVSAKQAEENLRGFLRGAS
jgi:hypothetical protein